MTKARTLAKVLIVVSGVLLLALVLSFAQGVNTLAAPPAQPALQDTCTVEVVKELVPDTDDGQFDLWIDGTEVVTNVGHLGSTGPQSVISGTHTISETAGGGASLLDYSTGYSCTVNGGAGPYGDGTSFSVNVNAGETVVCTFANTKRVAYLALTKTVTTDDGGTATGGDFQSYIDGNPVAWGATYPVTVGTHYASEDPLSGYSPSAWGGGCAVDGSITLGPGEIATCTITNDDQPAHLTVIKDVITDDGGSASASDFTMTISGVTVVDEVYSFPGEEDPGTTKQVWPGTYTVTETELSGYTATYDNCSGTIALGESNTCTITNDDIHPQLIVVKEVEGGTAGPYDFTMTVTGTNVDPSSFPGAGSPGTTVFLNAGSYSVSETGPDHYDASYSDDCSGSIAIGETKTCTVTNTARGRIFVDKVTDPSGDPRLFHFTLTGGPDALEVGFTLWDQKDPYDSDLIEPGAHWVTETDTTEFELASIECSDANSVGDPASRNATVNLEAGEIVTCTFTNLDIPSSIEVTKTADPSSVPEPGGTVTFTVVVSNTSEVDSVTISSLTDSVHGDISQVQGGVLSTTCSVTQTIAVGDDYACSFTAAVSGNYRYSETDVVTASGTDDDGIGVLGDDDATVDITDVPSSIEVTKTASPTSVDEPGDDVEYTIVVTNTSSVDDVTINSISDDRYTVSGCDATPPATLAPGENITCVFTEYVAGQPVDTFSNEATASGMDDDGLPVSDSDTADVTFNDVPSTIQVTKRADPTAVPEPGGTVTFTVVVSNTSELDAVTIEVLTDTIHGDITEVQGDVLSTTCSVTQTIAVGDDYACSFTAMVSGDYPYSEIDVVTASGTDDDEYKVIDSDTATVTIDDALPDISVTKTADPTAVPEPGGDVQFSIVATNHSLEDATIDSLMDTDFDLAALCSDAVGTVLAYTESYTCTFSQLIAGDADVIHHNAVAVVASDDEGNSDTDLDEATVEVSDVLPDIGVTKTGDPTAVPETGGDVEFSIVATNLSIEDATIDSLTDSDFDLGAHCSDAVGTVLTYTESYTCTFTERIEGDFSGLAHQNTATVTASDDDGNSDTGIGDATVDFTDVPSSIEVTKTADPSSVPEPGGPVTFTVVVSNTSEVDAVTIEVLTDTIHGDITEVQGDVLSTTCSVTQTIAVGDDYACSFTAAVSGNYRYSETDVVTASGTDDDGIGVLGDEDATVDITDVPSSIEVTKSAEPSSVPEPGGTITFTVLVSNTSEVDVVTIEVLTDSIYGDITQVQGKVESTTCSVPWIISVGGFDACFFTASVSGQPGDFETDVVTASGTDDDGTAVSDTGHATVTITNLPSFIDVTKTADPTSVPETGRDVTFTVLVSNTSAVDLVYITVLTDTVHGDITQVQGDLLSTTCSVMQTIPTGDDYTCSFTATPAGNPEESETNQVTASGYDDDMNPVSNFDEATVIFTDVLPGISVTKLGGFPPMRPEPGGEFAFEVHVTNETSEPVTLTSLEDTVEHPFVGRECPRSLWDDTATPAKLKNDGQPLEVGLKFEAGQDGHITGLRFYKGSLDDGTHIGHLWDRDGTLLAEAIFTGESAEGWQEVIFDVPVPITAYTTYVASYHSSSGYYATTEWYFVTAFDNPPLRALADGEDGPNGVYRYGTSGFPTSGSRSQNYWVDVVFDAAGHYTVDITQVDPPRVLTTTCSVPQPLEGDSTYECTFTRSVQGDPAVVTNTVTALAEDDDLPTTTSDSDDATITITLGLPPGDIAVTKTADPALVVAGDPVTFTVRIRNWSSVDVTLDWLRDSVYGELDGKGTCSLGHAILTGDYYECSFVEYLELSETDVAGAVVSDAIGRTAYASDSASVVVIPPGGEIRHVYLPLVMKNW